MFLQFLCLIWTEKQLLAVKGLRNALYDILVLSSKISIDILLL